MDHLSKDLQIELNTPIAKIAYSAAPAPAHISAPVSVESAPASCPRAAAASEEAHAAHEAAVATTAEPASSPAGSAHAADTHHSGATCHAVSPATTVHENADGASLVTVTTKDGAVYRARKIVVTASPHVINNKMIDFSPALPAEVADAFTYTLMNPITKV